MNHACEELAKVPRQESQAAQLQSLRNAKKRLEAELEECNANAQLKRFKLLQNDMKVHARAHPPTRPTVAAVPRAGCRLPTFGEALALTWPRRPPTGGGQDHRGAVHGAVHAGCRAAGVGRAPGSEGPAGRACVRRQQVTHVPLWCGPIEARASPAEKRAQSAQVEGCCANRNGMRQGEGGGLSGTGRMAASANLSSCVCSLKGAAAARDSAAPRPAGRRRHHLPDVHAEGRRPQPGPVPRPAPRAAP